MAGAGSGAGSATAISPHHSFSSLPAELRNRIWHLSLPDPSQEQTVVDSSALFFYRTPCWLPRRLSASDQGYDGRDPDNLALEFRHDLLPCVPMRLPPWTSVNREARAFAVAWMRGMPGVREVQRGGGSDTTVMMFVRRFDPRLGDVLYVAPGRMYDDFCTEPYDRLFRPDLLGRNVTSGPDVTRIAVPETVLLLQHGGSGGEAAVEIFEWFGSLEVLFIVVNNGVEGYQQLELEREGEEGEEAEVREDVKVQRRRWELGKAGRGLVWNAPQRRFEMEGENRRKEEEEEEQQQQQCDDEALYTRVDAAIKGLSELMTKDHRQNRSFEVRPVIAIRR